ncbi:hypothetical protein IE81DRAFT_323309 [Ceraceosorus guamensis]|uniref:Ribophorin II C-terminal domain-containing protein n=1 Tax=Ceraceosorus guamensis TaxID=1522189 RepID=A0A316VYM8_9BASI|nr:hypothetical protein IE81DRAFT_323309 [Ceraceosorus guamensis]PWN42552.1 hypothetical protein IE81DRAFT_323309 [Ceraceosorus guamensis]
MRLLRLHTLAALAALAPTCVLGASFTLTDAKLSITSLDGGSTRLSESFTATSTPKLERQNLAADEILRLSFSVKDANGEVAVPDQVAVKVDDDKRKSIVNAVAIKRGKAVYSLKPDKLSHLGRSITVSILVGSADPSLDPLNLHLLDLLLPGPEPTTSTQLTQRARLEQEQGFKPWPARFHTFGKPAADSMPPKSLSAIWAGAVLIVPWTVLLGLLSILLPSLSFKAPSLSIIALLLSLCYLESLAAVYWWSLTLFEMLPWLALGGVVATLTGKEALGQLRRWRLQSKSAQATT